MKRLLLLIVLVTLVFWITASHKRASRRPVEAWDEVRHVLNEVGDSLSSNDDRPHAPTPVFQPRTSTREDVEGLPVPIVAGTRVSNAEAKPPAQPRTLIAVHHDTQATPKLPATTVASPPLASAARSTVTGLISATEERAKADARCKLKDTVVDWLDPDVPTSWTPPSKLLDTMVLETRVKPVVKDYGILYEAKFTIDTSPRRRAQLVEVYNRELVERRLFSLGGALAFVLICLAAVSGYIRADEATKGYYTNRLRILAAAGVGAAGVLIYQMVA